VNGNQNYIESIGINQDGKMVAIIRTNQKVVRNNNDATHVARTVVEASEIPLNGLSNAAQADKIRQTYNNMLPMWSANFAGRESQVGTEQEMANQLDVVIDNYEPAPTQGPAPTPGAFVRTDDEGVPVAADPLPTIDITINEWSDMSKPAQRNFIMDEAVNRNSETIEFNGRQRRKWDTMTPTERKNELAKVRNELGRELKIDI